MLINLREVAEVRAVEIPYTPREIDFHIEQGTDGNSLTNITNTKGELIARINLIAPDLLLEHRWNWNTVAATRENVLQTWSFSPGSPALKRDAEQALKPRVHREFDAAVKAMALSKDAVHLAVATMRQLYVLHLGGIDIIVAADTDVKEEIESLKFTGNNRLLVKQGENTRILEMQR
jgi:hypothetical protein